jgi:Outer membrane protein beta-barrel domain
MRRNPVVLVTVGAFFLAAASVAQAQAGSGSKAFPVGYTDIGPTLGLGGIGSAGVAIGGRFEHGFRYMPEFNKGTLSFELSADWYHYSNRYAGIDYGFTYIPVGATLNYHFPLEDTKIDPFLGLGLGYESVSTKYGSASSDVYFIGRAGMRYRWKPNMALYGDLGAGAATLNVGIMFKVGGN